MPSKYIVRVDKALCKGPMCAICQYVCTQGIWLLGEEQPEGCVGCRRCVFFCPEMALDVVEVNGPQSGNGRDG